MASQQSKARVYIDTNRVISTISPLLFSGFAEHMGRSIYEGIYDPNSPHINERCLRTDVLAALRELNFRSIRYPGGNFVSGYNWEDGVGPVEQRPRRLDLAWMSTETNHFGTNEFIDWCKAGLAKFKVPKHVVFAELPKTSTGKIQKFKLRERAKGV